MVLILLLASAMVPVAKVFYLTYGYYRDSTSANFKKLSISTILT